MAASTDRERLERILLGQERLLEQVHQWLAEEQEEDDILRAAVLGSRGEHAVRIDDPDPRRVFGREAIKALCVKYRLRFLDAGLFKGGLPGPAIHAIRQLERSSDGHMRGFKVMAPARRFRLCDSEVDPLLFVPLGDGQYYLVHKWGGDLRWHRALLGWPFRSPSHLGALVLLVSVLFASLVPSHLVTATPDAGFWGAHRLLLLFWCMAVCASFTVFGWFAFFGQFSTRCWDSRHFN